MATNAKSNQSTRESTGRTPPCHKIRLGAIKSAIWKRESSDEKAPFYSVTFSRLYVDQDGRWAESTSFNRDDLLVLGKVSDMAHTWICEQQQRDRQNQAQGQESDPAF
jgi:hypothetical protein